MQAEAGERLHLAAVISTESARAGLDPLFVLALIEVESGFDVDAVSHRGARGLMQLRPATFRREQALHGIEGGDPEDPVTNVRAGIRYYARLLRDFRHNHELALMAYNAGPQRISRLRKEDGGIPERYRAYPRRVAAELQRLRGQRRLALAGGAQATASR
jgi:soluble lytic murein transglycosylase-like protein